MSARAARGRAPRGRRSDGLTLSVLVLGVMAFALVQSQVGPALPAIQEALGASETEAGWVMTAYLLSASVTTPLIGRIGDLLGKRQVLIGVLAVLAIGTILCALAPTIELLIAGRVVQGPSLAIFALSFGIIRDELAAERVPSGVGLIAGLQGLGGGAGVVLAGVVTDELSYHAVFWLPLVVTVLALVAAVALLPPSQVTESGGANWRAAALMSAGLVGVLVAIGQATTWALTSPELLGVAAAGMAFLFAWVQSERRAREPLVDMRMMRARGVWTTNGVTFLLGMGMYSSFLLVPMVVQEPLGVGFGASAALAGLAMLPTTGMLFLTSQAVGPVARALGSRAMLIAGMAVTVAGFALLVALRDSVALVAVASGLLGIGLGLGLVATANLIMAEVRQGQTGVAVGMNTIMRTIGGAVGSQLAAACLARQLTPLGGPSAFSYSLAFAVGGGAALLGLLLSLAVPRASPLDVPTTAAADALRPAVVRP